MGRRAALTGGGVGLASLLLAACTGSSDKSSASTGASGTFGSSKKLKFVFVNHVTTNPFFVPTRYGAQDALELELPTDRLVACCGAPVEPSVGDVRAATTAALESPLAFPPLSRAVVPGDHVVVALDRDVPQTVTTPDGA